MLSSDRLKGKKTLQVTGFLEEFEKDDIKKDIDIIKLFNLGEFCLFVLRNCSGINQPMIQFMEICYFIFDIDMRWRVLNNIMIEFNIII